MRTKTLALIEMLCTCVLFLYLQVYSGTAQRCRALTHGSEQLTANAPFAIGGHHIQLFEPARLASVFEGPGECEISDPYRCVLYPGNQKAPTRRVTEDPIYGICEVGGGEGALVFMELCCQQGNEFRTILVIGKSDGCVRHAAAPLWR